ncbi:MAG: pyrroline-5-carboxylate reductase [Bacteroidales bacterium]
MKVAIIGIGNMGSAMVKGFSRSSVISQSDITVTDVSNEAIEKLRVYASSIKYTSNNQEAAANANIIILAVKPWLVDDVIAQIKYSLDYKKQIIVSVAAGVTCEDLSKMFLNANNEVPPIYRVIPNIAFENDESMTFICTENGEKEQTSKIISIFEECGKALLINEKEMEAATALGSCGIAFAFRYISATMSTGVEMGFPATVSKEIAIQTLKGALTLLENSGLHPETLISKVTTPGGITIKGINELEHTGFSSSLIKAYKVCK